MQDIKDNELVAGQLNDELKGLFEGGRVEELEAKIRKEFDVSGKVRTADQGPLFVEKEVVNVKGYGYKVHAIVGQRIILMPHGPLEPDAS